MDFTSEADLVKRIGRDRVDQLLDDDGDGVADAEALAEIVDDANKTTGSLLLKKGFTADDLGELARDRFIRRRATEIAAMYAGRRRAEFLNAAGDGPYDKIGQAARTELKEMARGELRAPLEAVVGGNTTVRGATTARDPVYLVARNPNADPSDPGPGGFVLPLLFLALDAAHRFMG